MDANSRRKSFVAEVTNDHPKLQRPETTAKLYAVIRSAAHLRLLRCAQVLRNERKSASQQIHAPAIKNRQIERRKQPLVRIKYQRVCPFAAIENMAQVRNYGGRTSVRRVHMQPHPLALTNLRNSRTRIDTGARGRANRRYDAKGQKSLLLIFFNRLGERCWLHAKF